MAFSTQDLFRICWGILSRAAADGGMGSQGGGVGVDGSEVGGVGSVGGAVVVVAAGREDPAMEAAVLCKSSVSEEDVDKAPSS